MQLAEGVDTGAVYLHESVRIGEDETAGQLHDRLAALGAGLLTRTLRGLADGSVHAVAQEESGITHAPMLEKAEGSVDFAMPAQRVHDRIRGLDPWPAVTVLLDGRRLKLAASSAPTRAENAAEPGTVIAIDDAAMTVACADGHVRIASVQPEGKRAMTPSAYARGHALRVGDRLVPLPDFAPRSPRW